MKSYSLALPRPTIHLNLHPSHDDASYDASFDEYGDALHFAYHGASYYDVTYDDAFYDTPSSHLDLDQASTRTFR